MKHGYKSERCYGCGMGLLPPLDAGLRVSGVLGQRDGLVADVAPLSPAGGPAWGGGTTTL